MNSNLESQQKREYLYNQKEKKSIKKTELLSYLILALIETKIELYYFQLYC